VLARYHRLAGERVWFLTGTDEHSQNVAKAAAERGLTPQAWTDQIVPAWKEVFAELQISYDDFIRTSEPRHVDGVQRFLSKLHEGDDVYLGTYEGPYCVSCEEFKAEGDLVDGRCPIHLIPVEHLSEENYFFRLSRYQEPLLRLYEERPEFVGPAVRRNEVVSFVQAGLRDLSISRAAAIWEEPERFASIWPADVHMIGKDITRFHAVIWPAMLMAAGVPLPERVFGHGFLTVGGEKMSKSRGTGVAPADLIQRFGVDGLRYAFLREFTFGQDGNFSVDSLDARYTSELANGLGNLASRVLAMTGSYFDGLVPEPRGREAGGSLAAAAAAMAARYDAGMRAIELHEAAAALDEFIRESNRFVVQVAPWVLAKDPARRQDLADGLYESLEALRLAALFASPIMPGAAERLWRQLGLEGRVVDARLPEAGAWGGLQPGTDTRRGESLFPRLEE